MTPVSINRADVAGAISSFYGVAVEASAVARLAELFYPDVQQASARDPASWKLVFPGVLAKYESVARELGLGMSAAERDRAVLKSANTTDAAFAAALARLGFEGLRHYAAAQGGAARERVGREDHGSPSAHEPLSATAAASFAREIGVGPGYMRLFAGGSHEMRDALRDAIKSGKPITDDKIKSMEDVGMVLGAIRAGKLKADDPRIPDSVKKVMEDMKAKGIDPTKADPNTIEKYLKDNPRALEAARAEINKDKEAASGLDDKQLAEEVKKQADKAAGAAKKPSTAKPVAKTL